MKTAGLDGQVRLEIGNDRTDEDPRLGIASAGIDQHLGDLPARQVAHGFAERLQAVFVDPPR